MQGIVDHSVACFGHQSRFLNLAFDQLRALADECAYLIGELFLAACVVGGGFKREEEVVVAVHYDREQLVCAVQAVKLLTAVLELAQVERRIAVAQL